MRNFKLELAVGIFVLAGIFALGWLSTKLARMELMGGDSYPIQARFSSVSGLKSGANIEIAGVKVGRVGDIKLDLEEYEANVILHFDNSIEIQEDAIASVRTKGLIGDRYVKISPGASELVLKANDRLFNTEPSINFEELISQFIHGSIQ